MKNNSKKIFIVKFFVIPIVFTSIICAINYGFFWWNFIRVTNIQLVSLDQKACPIIIPVRYLDRNATELLGIPMYTPNGWVYTLKRKSNSNDMWITVCRWGVSGLVVYTARYEITDNNVKQKLLQLWDEHYKESPVNVE